MNSLASLVSYSCSGLTWAKNHVLPKAGEVAIGVFKGVAPHLLTLSPWFMSRMGNARGLPYITCIILSINAVDVDAAVHHPLQTIEKIKNMSPTKIISEIVNETALIAIIADTFMLFPQNLGYRLAVDGLYLTATLIRSSQAINAGVEQIIQGCKSSKTSEMISKTVSGGILTALGACSLASIYQTTCKLIQGLQVFKNLDSTQQEGVLKHRVVHELTGEKSCNAVIIDGVNDKAPFPSNEFLYQKCATRYYRANSPTQFCQALKDASSHFQSKIDALSLSGHASSGSLTIGPDYEIHAKSLYEFDCMRTHLPSDAQILMDGCNTATEIGGVPSLASQFSSHVPGREVTGYAAFYNPLMATSSYKNGKFKFDNLFPVREDDFFYALSPPFNARRFVNGQEV